MKKILILPYRVTQKFENSEYLPEGILEELIYHFSSVEEIQTTSRSTSLYLLNNPLPHHEIQSKFDVDYVLEGSIVIKENTFFYVSNLYDASNENLILALKTPFELDTWTAPLDYLAKEIFSKIIGLTAAFKSLKKGASKEREYYQQGLYHWNRFTYQEMLLAITFFKRAIKENPLFALSHAALADCYSIIGLMGYDDPKEVFSKATSAVNKALVLNEIRSEPYVAAAFVNIFHETDFAKAKINLEQALRLNKNNLKAHHVFAMYYIHVSDLSLAEKHAKLTLKMDPLSLPHYSMMGRICFYQRKFDKALDYVNKGLKINASAIPLIELKGNINLFSGTIEAAIENFKSCIDSDAESPLYYANLGYAYSKAGFYEANQKVESQLNKLHIKKDTGVFDYAMAILKLGQNDLKKFLQYLEKAAAYGVGFIPGELINNPMFSDVKKHARVREVLEKLNHVDVNMTVSKHKKPSNIISLKSATHETLELDPQDISFVEANDNYAIIYWFNADILTNKMLRISLKELEKQLKEFPFIVRCHKSYLINLEEQMKIKGNAKGYFFESSYLPKRIPISRNKAAQINSLFRKVN